MKRSLPILAATVLLAGCGSSGPSAQDQIRPNELKYLTGYIAGSVSQCQYVEQPAAKCEDSGDASWLPGSIRASASRPTGGRESPTRR